MILIFSDRFLTRRGISDHYDCYKAVKLAVTKNHNSSVDVKKEIGNELIGMLNQVFELYLHEYKQDFDQHGLKVIYEDLHTLLGFQYNLIVEVSDSSNDSSSNEE